MQSSTATLIPLCQRPQIIFPMPLYCKTQTAPIHTHYHPDSFPLFTSALHKTAANWNQRFYEEWEKNTEKELVQEIFLVCA